MKSVCVGDVFPFFVHSGDSSLLTMTAHKQMLMESGIHSLPASMVFLCFFLGVLDSSKVRFHGALVRRCLVVCALLFSLLSHSSN